MQRRGFLALGLVALAARAAALTAARAQSNYPERPIRLIIPFPPGGGFDAIGRPWADRIKPLLGTIVVENLGGGGSSLGAATVAHARPDGYTLLLGGSSTHITEAILKTRPLYDPLKDLDPIANIAVSSFALVVHPSIPATTLQEFIDYDKAHRGQLSYGHAGVGSLNHLTGELFKRLAGLPDLLQVPYRGSGPATADALAGNVAMVTPAVTGPLIEFHRAGKLRILAVTSPRRLLAAPDLPTAAETLPQMISQQSIGLFAPAGTAEAIINRIAAANRTLVTERDYQKMLVETGFEPDVDSSPEIFRRRIEAEIDKWAPIVATLGLKID
ncbi:MAG TPA: tripartite tricarboxylate transporter substrate binding protein [Xanthobacteraceae bacterium]|jgi:tripartite-type tricarboxylate transporter receptor subunit TctC